MMHNLSGSSDSSLTTPIASLATPSFPGIGSNFGSPLPTSYGGYNDIDTGQLQYPVSSTSAMNNHPGINSLHMSPDITSMQRLVLPIPSFCYILARHFLKNLEIRENYLFFVLLGENRGKLFGFCFTREKSGKTRWFLFYSGEITGNSEFFCFTSGKSGETRLFLFYSGEIRENVGKPVKLRTFHKVMWGNLWTVSFFIYGMLEIQTIYNVISLELNNK